MPTPNSSQTPIIHGDGGALALSAMAAVFWGTNFEATRIALIDLPSLTAAAGRRTPNLAQVAGVVIAIFGILLASNRLPGVRLGRKKSPPMACEI